MVAASHRQKLAIGSLGSAGIIDHYHEDLFSRIFLVPLCTGDQNQDDDHDPYDQNHDHHDPVPRGFLVIQLRHETKSCSLVVGMPKYEGS